MKRGLRACRGVAALLGALAASRGVLAQAPLVTDDTGTTPSGRVHFELFAQHARLPAVARPATQQQTLVFSAAYGAASRLELGFDIPWLAIRGPGADSNGLGDLDFTAKLRLRDGGPGRIGLAMTAAVELPTGDVSRGLGSGVRDEDVGLIVERALGARTTLLGNLGLQFAGNTLTGAVGSRDRGHVLSAGAALVRTLTDTLQVEGEVTGYQGRAHDSRDRELRVQLGATRTVNANLALAAAVQRGWYATPGWTLLLGVILDP